MSLKHMEDSVLDFAADLLHGPEAVGHITSGGSESIFVAMKAARDWSRANLAHVEKPEIVMPFSGHPTFNRASEYLGYSVKRIPVGADFRADVAAMERAITKNTIAIIGSAVCFPYGVVDPIVDLGRIAKERGLWLHVDACISAYSAPFCRDLGYPVPDFDFRVEGVTSISGDLHKYGFCAKGTSTVLYRDPSYQKYQPFAFDNWPNGTFANPNVAGSRPGGSISAAWAVLSYLGRDGYLRLNKRLMEMRQHYIDGINAIEGLQINGQPHSLIISFRSMDSKAVNADALADGMLERGWFLGRQRTPPGLMMGLSLPHEAARDDFLRDLSEVVTDVRKGGDQPSSGRAIY
jgi:glutamate/tyrosine decarboxylase-like PLP-dependent enzyme